MIKPGLAVAGLEHLLNPVLLPLGANHFGQGGASGPALLKAESIRVSPTGRITTRRSSGPIHPSCLARTRTLLASTTSGPVSPPRLRRTRRPDVAPLERHLALAADAANLLESQPEVESVQDKNGVLVVKMKEDVTQYSFLASRLIEQGYELTLFKEDEINLETAFMHLTKGITS